MTGLPLVRSPGRALKALGFLGVAAAGGDDLSLVQERIRHRNRLIKQATRIVAQIEHEAFDLVGPELGGEIPDRLLQPSAVCSLNCVMRI